MRSPRRAVLLLLVSALVLAACQGTLKSSATPTPEQQVTSSSWCESWPGTTAWYVFRSAADPLFPRPELLAATGNPPRYFQMYGGAGATLMGYSFLDTFAVTPPGLPVAGWLAFAARPFATPQSQDDRIRIYSGTTPTLLHQFYLGTSGNIVGAKPLAWLPSNYSALETFTYTFTTSQLATMFTSGVLDYQIGDDTLVNWVELILCIPQPTPTPTPRVIPTAGVATVTGPTTALDTEPSPTPTVVKRVTPAPGVTPIPLPTPTPTPTPTATPAPTPTATASGNCDLAVSKQMEMIDASGVYHVAITVQNIGSGSCPAGAVLSDPAPTGTSFSGPLTITEPGASGNWSCSGTTCTAGSALPPGYIGTFGFTATTHQRPVTNCAAITSGSDVNTGNNRSCVQVP